MPSRFARTRAVALALGSAVAVASCGGGGGSGGGAFGGALNPVFPGNPAPGQSPAPAPDPAPSPLPSPDPSASPSSGANPSPRPSPNPRPSPSASPSPSPHPTPSPTPHPTPTPTRPPGPSATITRGPYLQATSTSQVTVVWSTATPTSSVVSYGPAGSFTAQAGNPTASETDHAVTVTGLAPATRYAYRILAGGQPVGAAATFATASGPGSTFTALALGDTGSGTPAQLDLAHRLVQEHVDLVLHTGDVIYPAGEASNYDPRFFQPYEPILATTPVFPTIGNHDLWDGMGALAYGNVFKFVRNNPQQSKRYYSFEWGDAKFISIETYELFQTPGPHIDWLESELASNTRRWLVVFMHVPLYSVGLHGDDPNLQQLLEPLFERYKVDLLLAGHDHDYSREGPIKRSSTDPTWPGFTSIVTGGGGAELYWTPHRHSFTRAADSSHHYVLLTFSPGQLAGRAVRSDGSVADEFALSKN